MRCKYAAGEKLLDQTWDRARHHDLLGTGAVLAAGERHRTGLSRSCGPRERLLQI